MDGGLETIYWTTLLQKEKIKIQSVPLKLGICWIFLCIYRINL